MKILISPSKSVTERAPVLGIASTQPLFGNQTAVLLSQLQKLSAANRLGAVLGVSEQLAALNVERYECWDDQSRRRSAIWMYSGDVYNGLDAFSLDVASAQAMQDRLMIISGLYGLVRPLDLIQPYRLDMSVKLKGSWGKDLYRFWGDALAKYVEGLGANTVLVCASREYSGAVVPRLPADITAITPRFLQPTPTGLKEKSLFAKHARGTLARWVVDGGVDDPADLKDYRVDGFSYSHELSTPSEPVFLVPEDFSLLGRYTKV
jgi:cytoplasmic iron level regulating protein YaaA (DUF328/UPF0246 family)